MRITTNMAPSESDTDSVSDINKTSEKLEKLGFNTDGEVQESLNVDRLSIGIRDDPAGISRNLASSLTADTAHDDGHDGDLESAVADESFSGSQNVYSDSSIASESGVCVLPKNKVDTMEEHGKWHETRQEWLGEKKKLLVLTHAGKPVYASHGDESELSAVFGLLQAIVARTGERVRVVRAGEKFSIVFNVFDFLLVAILSHEQEPAGYIELQLNYAYRQIIFHLTHSALHRAFKANPGYDLRPLLCQTTKSELIGVLNMASTTPFLLLESVPILPLPASVRHSVTNILMSIRQRNIAYALLLAGQRIVTFISPKRHTLKATDAILLLNFVNVANQLRSQETWTPLCLPGFDKSGFLHAYVSYVSKNTCVIILSAGEDLEQFHYCSNACEDISDQLSKGVGEQIEDAVRQMDVYSPEDCGASPAFHLVYHSLKHNQCFETGVSDTAPFHQNDERSKRLLMEAYYLAGEMLRGSRPAPNVGSPTASSNSFSFANSPDSLFDASTNKEETSNPSPGKLFHTEVWDVRDNQAILGILSPQQHEIYAAFSPFTSAAEAKAAVQQFLAWTRSSKLELFITKTKYW